MKKKIVMGVLTLTLFVAPSFAGVAKLSYRYGVKPAAKASFASAKFAGREGKKAPKASYHAGCQSRTRG